jgi:FixJ family two-component response regulator
MGARRRAGPTKSARAASPFPRHRSDAGSGSPALVERQPAQRAPPHTGVFGVSPSEPIVFVVDDDEGVRNAVAGLLDCAGLHASCFASASAFLAAERADVPSCLVLDLDLPDLSGLELQRALVTTQAPPIVFISGHGDVPSSVRAMKAGAVEFLAKPFDDEALLRAIDTALALDRGARQQRSEQAELRRRYERLTPREREVLPFVVAGFANKQTASELGTSEITIAVHRSQLMRKMDARSLADLIRMADKLAVVQRDLP